jgi:catechol 2,3-dioxygenase-like lactoylglutathione lyase family enzyme
MPATAIHHIQLAMPRGEEDRGRAFYGSLLGLIEIPKPATLNERGGLWFQIGALELHLGIEDDFRPAKKAHPGLLVDDLTMLVTRLEAAGHPTKPDHLLEGYERAYVYDPFGNRIELLEPTHQR